MVRSLRIITQPLDVIKNKHIFSRQDLLTAESHDSFGLSGSGATSSLQSDSLKVVKAPKSECRQERINIWFLLMMAVCKKEKVPKPLIGEGKFYSVGLGICFIWVILNISS